MNLRTMEKRTAIVIGSIFILSLVPLLIIAFYNVMCADDYSYGFLAHKAYMESHSVLSCLKAATQKVHSSYFGWQGTYSAIFLMALQPGIISEKLYFLTTYFVLFFFIGGTIYFTNVLLREYLKIDVHLVIIIVSVFFICAIQGIPYPSQAFYWYNGSVFYMGFHGIMMFYLGLLIKNSISEKCSVAAMVVSLIVGIILGGGNYVTALLTLELSFLVVFICWREKGSRAFRLVLPVIVNSIGFFISAIAPGNQIRQQYFLETKLDAGRAILYSFMYGINYINKWINIWVILGIALLVPFIWKAVKNLSFKWRYPGIIVILSFCIFSSSFTPTLFAQGMEGAGRVQDIQYVYFITMLLIDIFYIEGWISNRLTARLSISEKVVGPYVLFIIVCLGVSFIFNSEKGNFISYSAMRSLLCGGGGKQQHINKRQMKELLF